MINMGRTDAKKRQGHSAKQQPQWDIANACAMQQIK
jgi:hypothetical protein